MNVESSRVYAYFMFVVEAMLRYVTFRLSSRDVSSQAFPVFNVSRPRTIKRSQVKRRNGEGLEPRLGIYTYNNIHLGMQLFYALRANVRTGVTHRNVACWTRTRPTSLRVL